MFRIEPNLPTHLYKTYEIRSPLSTHYRPSTCEEAGCEQYENGWMILVNESTDQGRHMVHLIKTSGRHYVEVRVPGKDTEYVFEPGQQCFNIHQARLDRPEIYIEKGGDWRGNPRGEHRVHTKAQFWVESFAEHQDKLSTVFERG